MTYITKAPNSFDECVLSKAVVEYIGTYPGAVSHGNKKQGNARAYTRAHGHVMEEMGREVKGKSPRAVYQRMERDNPEEEAPRNLRQVQNKKYREKNKLKEENPVQPLTRGNLGCQIRHVETLLQQHPFVQRVWQGKGVVPCVVLHNEEQMLDLKRFCCSAPAGQSAVLGFDKTFNLTNLHVTIAVFKNLSVFREGTENHPLFIGPIFIHGTSDFDTFGMFFDYLSRQLIDCSSSPILGSDDEKAMKKAMTHAFPRSDQLVCTRHLKKNTADYLAQHGTNADQRREVMSALFGKNGISKADSQVVLEERIIKARETIEKHAPKFLQHFNSRILNILQENFHIYEKNLAVPLEWMNNDCESANNIVKQVVDWKTKFLTELINLLHDEVKSQYKGLERALIGRGNFVLVPEYDHHRMDSQVYCSKTEDQRQRRFKKFLREVKRTTPRGVTSADGQLTVLSAVNGGKKPGQTKRRRATKTKTGKRKCVR